MEDEDDADGLVLISEEISSADVAANTTNGPSSAGAMSGPSQRRKHPWPLEPVTRSGASHARPDNTFKPETHKMLESELKQLYVGVTRARKRLLFFDEGDAEVSDAAQMEAGKKKEQLRGTKQKVW